MPSTILSDNGASSGTAGIKTTGSNDGQLALQTTTAGGTATTAMTIDTSQNVGVGATPTAFSTARTLEIAGSSTNSAALRLRGGGDTAGTDDAVIYKVNGNTGAVYIRNYANGRLGFWTNNAQLVEFQTGGAVTLKGASDAANGTGITFPATQSASSDANTLDDYEEGTWTPSVGGTTSNPTLTYATRVGYYTKVGRVVTIHCGIQPSTTSVNGDGQLVITGLPFTSANLSDCIATGVSSYNGNLDWGTNKTSLVLAVSPNVSRVSVWGMQNATAEAGVGVTAFTTSSQYLFFSLTYIAA